MGSVHVCQVARGPELSVLTPVQRDIEVLSTRRFFALRRVFYEVICNIFVISDMQLSSEVCASSDQLNSC